MAHPRIGIFGALVAVGGVIAWRWAQKHRASQARLVSELNRWEGEGGAVGTASQTAPAMSQTGAPPGIVPNGAGRADSMRDAWHFPHGA